MTTLTTTKFSTSQLSSILRGAPDHFWPDVCEIASSSDNITGRTVVPTEPGRPVVYRLRGENVNGYTAHLTAVATADNLREATVAMLEKLPAGCEISLAWSALFDTLLAGGTNGPTSADWLDCLSCLDEGSAVAVLETTLYGEVVFG